MASLVDINYTPLIPQEIIGVIIVNTHYENAPGDLKNVNFTTAELERIQPLFKKLCKEVIVLEDPNFQRIEDLFADLNAKVGDLNKSKSKKDVDGKKGLALLFHYLGHGAMLKCTTHMWINQEQKENENPFPIEQRLKSFTQLKNTIVFGTLNCCRNEYKNFKSEKPEENKQTKEQIQQAGQTLGGTTQVKDFKGQLFLLFASPANQSAPATEVFGKKYAEALTDKIEKGFIHLPDDFQTYEHAKEEIRHITEQIHFDVILDEVVNQRQNVLNFDYFYVEGLYTGQMFKGKRHGKGTFSKHDQLEFFDGLWYQDQMHGYGTYKDISKNSGKIKTSYQGDFRNHKFHGVGSYLTESGESYEGEWKNGIRHGKGKRITANKESYEGYYELGLRSGEGIQNYSDGGSYDGYWLNDERHCSSMYQQQGVQTFANGDIYRGDWKNDQITGNGCFHKTDGTFQQGRYENGKLVEFHYGELSNLQDESIFVKQNDQTCMNVNGYYTGYMLNKKRQGKGIFVWTQGNLKGHNYDGNWNNDLMDGEGEYYEGQKQGNFALKNCNHYKGCWKDGLKHGYGEEKKGKSIYKGHWILGQKFGEGVEIYGSNDHNFNGYFSKGEKFIGLYTDRNGTKTQGAWYNDQLHGKVDQRFTNGESYVGDMQNGKKHGKGKHTRSDGVIYDGDFRDGEYYGYGKLSSPNETYEGDFRHGKYYGYGILTLPNVRYEGDFRDGLKHGEGEETHFGENGQNKIYKGFFSQDHKHGRGIEECPSYTFDGEWNMNEKWNGEGVCYTKEGKAFKFTMKDGQ